MKKFRLPKGLLLAIAVVVSGIAVVSADSSASSKLTTIASGSHDDIEMNCSYNGHQGGAKATVSPGSVYLKWKLDKKIAIIYYNQAEQNITGLSTSSWSWTSGYSKGTGTFRHRFTAQDGSYTGNIKGLNYS